MSNAKPRPIISGQAAVEVGKVSDLIEVAGSTTTVAVWVLDGTRYEYTKGQRWLVLRNSGWGVAERLLLDAPTKTAAKRAVLRHARGY